MENIIRKSIEGGYDNDATRDLVKDFGQKIYARYDTYCMIVLDPLFWQALGKACGWESVFKNDSSVSFRLEETGKKDKIWCYMEMNWEYYALRFHEVNLTEGWDAAVAYLVDLIKK